ncbi:MAG: error-prone DNA polymerase [Lautropia sp.]
MTAIPPYAELHCTTNFSFLRGASQPEELVERAHALRYAALAITDECSLAGVVRAHQQAKACDFKLLIGSEFAADDLARAALRTSKDLLAGILPFPRTEPSEASMRTAPMAAAPSSPIPPAGSFAARLRTPRLVLLACRRDGYGNLSQLITTARRRTAKGTYRLLATDLADGLADCFALWVPSRGDHPAVLRAQVRWLQARFGDRLRVAVELFAFGNEKAWLAQLRQLSHECSVKLVAAGDVHYHVRSRKSLQDVVTAIHLGTTVEEAGYALAPNAEQHLRSRLRLAQRYPVDLLEETLEVAAHCSFSLGALRYEYPREIVPPEHTPTSWLAELTEAGSRERYPQGVPDTIRQQLQHELALIAELEYEPYFLTVADIVREARRRGILCQGRGSAANSAVCYCLRVTEVDPTLTSLLFERFISRERKEPPDIDVDFEHDRREEIMQYIYDKYGRDRAALTATVISYRARSAIRDAGRALGVDAQRAALLTRGHQWWDGSRVREDRLREAGFDPDAPLVQHWVRMATLLMKFPRHLSQHTGGFVIARDSLSRLVPIENAAMADRSVIQWDKDDLESLGLLKVDVLALGMLSAIRRALDFLTQRRGRHFEMSDIPKEDSETYDMICRADTIGVFQIESRAQMSMLPRLQPRIFYDLVIEVAIVRPGPIQGGMVHPYLRRRRKLEPDDVPLDEIKPALARTLGVPIFQEQVMQVAIIAAKFTPGEADRLRRAMAAWKRKGGLHDFQERVIERMVGRGYAREFAERLFKQIEGFGEYGFPESHAASFALLVYVSSWLKCHEPAAFLAALLNSQPMGFYAPAQLVRDAREHGVRVLPVDVTISHWESTLEETTIAAAAVDGRDIDRRPQPAVRLGMSRVSGISKASALRIVASRAARTVRWPDVETLAREAQLGSRELQALARADALASLAGHRLQAAWQAAGVVPMPALLTDAPFAEAPVALPAPTEAQNTIADYRALGLPMGRHPLALLRGYLARQSNGRIATATVLRTLSHGRLARASGIVTHRQRPETAKGVVFLTLEDESGAINVIVWPKVLERFRTAVVGGQLLTIHGTWQRDVETGGQVMHLLANRIVDDTRLLGELTTHSRDFH